MSNLGMLLARPLHWFGAMRSQDTGARTMHFADVLGVYASKPIHYHSVLIFCPSALLLRSVLVQFVGVLFVDTVVDATISFAFSRPNGTKNKAKWKIMKWKKNIPKSNLMSFGWWFALNAIFCPVHVQLVRFILRMTWVLLLLLLEHSLVRCA